MNLTTFRNHRKAGLRWTLALGHSVQSRDPRRSLLLLAFGAVLWLANVFPLQSPHYLCTATAVVSPERWRELVTLSHTTEIRSENIQWIAYQNQHHANFGGAIDQPTPPNLRVLKIRIGLNYPKTSSEIDRELERLTRVERVATNESGIQQQLSKDRWRLRVAEHALSRFRLDHEREGLFVDGSETSTPFRLASRSSTLVAQLAPLDRATWDSLRLELEAARQAVSTAEKGIECSKAQSAGYIALTGAPRLSALPGAFSWIHFGILALLGIVISFGFHSWVYGLATVIGASQRRLFVRPRRPNDGPAVLGRNRLETELAASLQRIGVAYWGAIQTSGRTILESSTSDDAARANTDPLREVVALKPRVSQCAAIADFILATWVVAFTLRYALDAVWRELLFRAPLAAFSSIVFGI